MAKNHDRNTKQGSELILETLTLGPFATNCYIIASGETKEGVLIDAPFEPEKIISKIKELGINLKYLILTHAHVDHIAGIADIKKETNAKILINKLEMPLYEGLAEQSSMFGIDAKEPPPPDQFIEDNDEIAFSDYRLKVIHTPGHSPGGVCLLMNKILFSGDTLFYQGIGRTDLYGGDYDELISSIRRRLLSLDGDTVVYPGHGPETCINFERLTNPFLI